MKKIYKAPTTYCMKLHSTSIIAISLNSSEQISSSNQDEYEQNVKAGSSSSYNVWNDDWSE